MKFPGIRERRGISCGGMFRAAVILLAAFTCGCDDYWFGEGSETIADVVTPDGVQSGVVSIEYILSGEPSEADVLVSYSGNGGLTFRKAREAPGGEGTRGLSVSSSGDFHTFLWDSAEDMGNERNSGVVVRVKPIDGASGRSEDFAVHNARWLAAVEESRGDVRLYSLDVDTGDLDSRQAIPTGDERPCGVLFFKGHFLVAHEGSDFVAALSIDEEEGLLSPTPGSVFHRARTGAKYLDSHGENVYVLNVDDDSITIFDFDPPSGRLSLNPASGVSIPGADRLLVHGHQLYLSRTIHGDIVVLDIQPGGALLLDGASPVAGNGLESPGPLIVVDRRLYAFNTQVSSICGFAMEEGGRLVPLSGSPFDVSTAGLDRVLRRDNRLYAVESRERRIVLLELAANGSVNEQDCSPADRRAVTSLANAGDFLIVGAAKPGKLELFRSDDRCQLSVASSSLLSRDAGRVHTSLSD